MAPGLVGRNAASAARALSRSSSAGFREEVARLTSALIKKYSASGTLSCSATTASQRAGLVKKSGKWRWTGEANDDVTRLYRAVHDGLDHLQDTTTLTLRFAP